MTPEERVDAGLAAVERGLHAFVSTSVARAERHSPHYAELWREMRTSLTGGKRVRPRLLLAAYTQLCGHDDEHAIRLAIAVELLHTALLVHDDIIDGDLERRGVPNLVGAFGTSARSAGVGSPTAERWGETAGILAGDLLLTGALRMAVLPELDRPRAERIAALVDESVFRAAAGELADVAYAAGLSTPSMGEIRDMMADKTAHYSLELPLRAAAVLAGLPEDAEDRLGAIGGSLGVLFQMTDDLLGVFGDPDVTGKSACSDLREGKQTLLVAFARDTDAWRSAAGAFGDARLDEAGADALRHALEESGARASFEADIRREHAAAVRLIRAAGLPAGLAATLESAADAASRRRA